MTKKTVQTDLVCPEFGKVFPIQIEVEQKILRLRKRID